MSEKEVTMMPMVQLPSGVAIRADKILFISRKEINQYVAFMENAPQAPLLTGDDVDMLRAIGAIQGQPPEAASDPKIVGA